LEGYEYCFVKNVSPDPGTQHFKGIINPTLIRQIEAWKPTAILVYGWNFKSHLHCLRYFHKKVPVLFRGDSTLLDEKPGLKKMLRRVFLKWVYSHVDIALYVGIQNKLYFIKHGLKKTQLVFAPHAVDNERFFDKGGSFAQKAVAWRRQLNIPDDDLVFLFAGKLEPKKDPASLIRAFMELSVPGIHLILVGNGILENALKEKYANIINLHFIDFQNQSLMPVVYRLGDVFVLPSSGPGESWGLSVNEAMACDRPVLVSNKAGCRTELVEEGNNGYGFSAGNRVELTGKMQLFIDNKNELFKMGKASSNRIHSWNFESIAVSVESMVLKMNHD
ncbi:MAG TPA: glycosyltransferase family 4 protein, partial [Chitinophagaceae bacterium]|nr:glycosyltransferase family 4 protein [Chitinophagaceae bacterium]